MENVKYEVTFEEKKNRAGCWSSNTVTIHSVVDGVKTAIGSYERNYPSYVAATFFPFRLAGKDYALYSRDYTATRVMSLPDCKDLGGEEPDGIGFCPTEFYVPEKEDDSGEFFPFGFVAGCIFGDDSSWKIEHLDLKDADKGIIKRDNKFGYIQLPNKISLKDAISISDWSDYDELSFLYVARQDLYRLRKDYSFEKYFSSDIVGDILRTVKSHGFQHLVDDILGYFAWYAKCKPQHQFSEDEQKLHELIKSIKTNK